MTHKKTSPLKSVVEESSSVSKAIEKAWVRIGKPVEFSVKVFETEQRNFLGMSVKPAKVGLFFQAGTTDSREQGRPDKIQRPDHRQERPERIEREKAERPERPEKQQLRVRPLPKDAQQHEPRRERESRQKSMQAEQGSIQRWPDDMVASVRSWLQNTLHILGKDAVTFTTETQNYYLRISFSQPLWQDREKEKTFFRLSAYLIMQSLRTSSKEGFRGFKIIMSST